MLKCPSIHGSVRSQVYEALAVSRAAWAFSTFSSAHSTNVRLCARLADTVAVASASGGASGGEVSGGSAAAARGGLSEFPQGGPCTGLFFSMPGGGPGIG